MIQASKMSFRWKLSTAEKTPLCENDASDDAYGGLSQAWHSFEIPDDDDQSKEENLDPIAEMTNQKIKELEEKQRAAIAKLQAEAEEFKRKLQENTENELKKNEEESAMRLHEIDDEYALKIREKEAKEQKELEVFEALKSTIQSSTKEFEAIESELEDSISQRRREIHEEDRQQRSEFKKEQEEQAILQMMMHDEEKIEICMELEETRKKTAESVKSYQRSLNKKAEINLKELKKEVQDHVNELWQEN